MLFLQHSRNLTLIFIFWPSSRSPLNMVTGAIFRVLSAPNNEVGLSTYTILELDFSEKRFSKFSFSSIILFFAFSHELLLTTIFSILMPCAAICTAMVLTCSSLVPSYGSLIGHTASVIRHMRFFPLFVSLYFFISISNPTTIASTTTKVKAIQIKKYNKNH